MSSALDSLSDGDRRLLRRSGPPQRAEAMKAVLTSERFSDPDWVFERKLDGIRCFAIRDGRRVRLLSRNNLSMDERYPEIAEALAGQPCERFAIDGEVVAFAGSQTSFAKLAQRRRRRVPIFLYAFDVVWIDGQDTRALPLRSRKALLRAAFEYRDPLRFTTHRNRDGEALFAEACRKGWEGLIAKRAGSPYVTARSRDWLKLKCEQGQELVIGGFTEPHGSRVEFGALLVGHYDGGGALRYAGKVGTGFDRETLEELGARMRALAREEPAFADRDALPRRATWVEPELVAQVGFTEWTRDGRLRHPRFLGLREDKPPRAVVRES